MKHLPLSIFISAGISILLAVLLYQNGSHNGINYGDGQDLLLAARSGGLAHPPGYPILILQYRGLHYLFPHISWAAVGSLVSAITMAAAVGLGSTVFAVSILSSKLPMWFRLVLSWFLNICFLTIPHIWLFGLVPEIMPFAIFLLVLLITITTRKMSNHSLQAFLIGFIAVLAILYHALMAPGVAIILGLNLMPHRNNHLLPILRWLVVGGVVGLILTGISYSLLLHTTEYGWQPPTSVNEWWQFWSRSAYDQSRSAVDMYSHDWNPRILFLSLIYWWTWLIQEAGWGLILLAAIGVVMMKKSSPFFWALVLGIVGYGIILPGYIKSPTVYHTSELAQWYGIALRERMFYPLFLILIISTSLGIKTLVELLQIHRKPKLMMLLGILCISLSLLQLYLNIQRRNINVSNASTIFTEAVLRPLPSEAILLVDSDEIFNLLYAQQILNFRPDIHLVSLRMPLSKQWYRPNQFSQLGFQPIPEYFAADVIGFNLAQHRRVFLFQFDDSLLNFIGGLGNPLYAVPFGYTLELTTTPPASIEAFDYGVSVQLSSMTQANSDAWFKYSEASLSYIHTQLAYLYALIGAESASDFHLNQAKRLVVKPSTQQTISSVINIARQQYQLQGNYLSIKPQTTVWWLNQGQAVNNNPSQAIYYYSRVILLDPNNLDAWKMLAQLYQQTNQPDQAEYAQMMVSHLKLSQLHQ